MNKEQAATDAAAPVVYNVLNDVLLTGGGLFIGVGANDKMN